MVLNALQKRITDNEIRSKYPMLVRRSDEADREE